MAPLGDVGSIQRQPEFDGHIESWYAFRQFNSGQIVDREIRLFDKLNNLLFFSWVSYRLTKAAQLAIADSRVAVPDRKSFGQSFGLPRATLGLKATPLAEIVIRAFESSGRANGYLDQARAMLPAKSAIFYIPLKRELIGRLWR